MVNIRHKSLFLRVCGMVLVCIFSVLLVWHPAGADVGPQPVLPGGSNIQPGEVTPIQMVSETVTMNIRAATEADNASVSINPEIYGYNYRPIWFPGVAEVEADFTMKNPTTEEVSIDVWFPLASALENVDWQLNTDEIVPSIESFQVRLDGKPLDFTVSELPNPKGADMPPLPWASFPVTFPAGEETAIHVSYTVPLQPAVKSPEMALHYIFQTGAGWAESIGQAELILNLPYPASEGTLAGMRKLFLPPLYIPSPAELPAGAVLEGNQARWTWKDFEPGPEDDFSIWLLRPEKWQELETARLAVEANSNDGQAWLNLANTYITLSCAAGTYSCSVFNPAYLPLAVEAYRKAIDLMPDHPAPHTGLGLLTLTSYLQDKNASPEVIQSVLDELQVARELEAKNPSLVNEASFTSGDLAEALRSFFKAQFATETAETILLVTPSTTPTQRAILTASPIAKPILTPTPSPSITSHPALTISPTPSVTTGTGQSLVIIIAVGVIILVIVGYLVWKRSQKGA